MGISTPGCGEIAVGRSATLFSPAYLSHWRTRHLIQTRSAWHARCKCRGHTHQQHVDHPQHHFSPRRHRFHRPGFPDHQRFHPGRPRFRRPRRHGHHRLRALRLRPPGQVSAPAGSRAPAGAALRVRQPRGLLRPPRRVIGSTVAAVCDRRPALHERHCIPDPHLDTSPL